MLKQPVRIFQITGKQVLDERIIRFILDSNLNYPNEISNHIYCANISPYNIYKEGDFLGISIKLVEERSASSQVFNETSLVVKVKRAPDNYNGTTITDLYFGRG